METFKTEGSLKNVQEALNEMEVLKRLQELRVFNSTSQEVIFWSSIALLLLIGLVIISL